MAYHPGDWVIYRKTKFGLRPGPRAENVVPARSGEQYSYEVDKYWVVAQVLHNSRVVLMTRRGKMHEVSTSDPLLRRANLWERWLLRQRFPQADMPDPPISTRNAQAG